MRYEYELQDYSVKRSARILFGDERTTREAMPLRSRRELCSVDDGVTDLSRRV